MHVIVCSEFRDNRSQCFDFSQTPSICSARSRTISISSGRSRTSSICSESPSQDDILIDPFYENIGLVVRDQEELYISGSQDDQKSTTNHVDIELEDQLVHFLRNEAEYCDGIRRLLQLRYTDKENEFDCIHRHLKKMLHAHENLDLENVARSRNINVFSIVKCFIRHSQDLICYIGYIRDSQKLDKTIKLQLANDKTSIDRIVLTRKRIHYYFMCMDEWRKLVNSTDDDIILCKAIQMLKNIYKTADSHLIVDSVTQSPVLLDLYQPLLRHSMFTVEGKCFDKGQPYKVLLFRDILVFTISSPELLECFEVLRLEQISLDDSLGVRRKPSQCSNSIRLEVFHSKRRGGETILMFGKNSRLIKEWTSQIQTNQNLLKEKLTTS